MFSVRKLPFWHVDSVLFKPYNQDNRVMKVLFFHIWWFGYIQFQLTILICLNRFASIVLPKYYRKHWTNRATKIAIFVIFLNTMCIAFPILFLGVTVAQYTSVDDGIMTFQTVGPTFMKHYDSQTYMFTWKFHVYAILAVCTTCYIIMFIKVKEIRILLKKSAMRREFRLLYPMTVLYIVNFLYIGYFALTDYWVNTDHPFSRNSEWTIYIASDAYDLNNAYVIMLTSSEVRAAVYHFLRIQIKKKCDVVVSLSLFSK
uniref:Serpentine receptor class gamma n=1 Tax=Panagrellus redivivus TaxID=6233 RepID=A0A7E4WDH3_PANRE